MRRTFNVIVNFRLLAQVVAAWQGSLHCRLNGDFTNESDPKEYAPDPYKLFAGTFERV